VEDQRVEVDAVRPCDSAVVDRRLGKELRVLERLEHRAPEFVDEIDVTNKAVVEAHVQAMRRPHLDRDDFGDPGDLLHGIKNR
jgi:hypothetical protein